MAKRILTEADINSAVANGEKSILCPASEWIITPQAADKAIEYKIEILEKAVAVPAPAQPVAPEQPAVVAPVVPAAPVAKVQPEVVVAAPVEEQCSLAAPVATSSDDIDGLVAEVCAILQERLPEVVAGIDLEKLVRKVVVAKLAKTSGSQADENEGAPCGVTVIEGDRLLQESSGGSAIKGQVFVADALGDCVGAELAGGYMEWESASFTRTVECAEVGVVVSGELHLDIAGKKQIAKAGDMVYLPAGVEVTYGTPTAVRIACINNVA